MKIMATSFKRSCARIRHCCTQCRGPCSRPPPTHTSTRDSWTLTGKSGPVSCGATAPFFWVLVHTGFCLCPPRVCFPVLSNFWWIYGRVNDNLLKESFCHTWVCCTQRPCPCGSPLLTCTSTGDTQTQYCLSLWCLWILVCTRYVWAIWASLAGMELDSKCEFALLSSCWGFSFALGRRLSPHSCSS